MLTSTLAPADERGNDPLALLPLAAPPGSGTSTTVIRKLPTQSDDAVRQALSDMYFFSVVHTSPCNSKRAVAGKFKSTDLGIAPHDVLETDLVSKQFVVSSTPQTVAWGPG